MKNNAQKKAIMAALKGEKNVIPKGMVKHRGSLEKEMRSDSRTPKSINSIMGRLSK